MISVSPELKRWFESRSTANRTRAAERAAALTVVDGYLIAGWTVSVALFWAARRFGVSTSTVAAWRRQTLGVPAAERIFHLCDRRGS